MASSGGEERGEGEEDRQPVERDISTELHGDTHAKGYGKGAASSVIWDCEAVADRLRRTDFAIAEHEQKRTTMI